MLGVLLIYFIGKRFYDLSEEYDQSKWGYAILGIVVYYALGFLLVMVIVLLDVWVFNWDFDWDSSFGMNLLVLPFGLLAVWIFYHILENKWKKKIIVVKDEIQDIGKQIED